MSAPVTIRIGRVVVQGASQAEAETTAASLRTELARLITERGLPSGWRGKQGAQGPLRAITPGGRGREAAARILKR